MMAHQVDDSSNTKRRDNIQTDEGVNSLLTMKKKNQNPAVSSLEEEEQKEGRFISSLSSSHGTTWRIISSLIIVLGTAASAAFIALGWTAAQRDFEQQFHEESLQVAKAIQDAMKESEVAGRWIIHEATTSMSSLSSLRQGQGSSNISTSRRRRRAFRELYENLQHADSFQAVAFCPNISHVDRAAAEEESKRYYRTNYPNVSYTGFMATAVNQQNHDDDDDDDDDAQLVESSPPAPFYFPLHYLEPVEGNEIDIDYDIYSGASSRQALETALETWQPALTGRMHIVKKEDPHNTAYSVMLIHPGIPLSTRQQPDDDDMLRRGPRDVAVVEIRIHAILERALPYPIVPVPLSIYLYDTSSSASAGSIQHKKEPSFLGGVVDYDGRHGTTLTFSPSDADELPANLEDLKQQHGGDMVHEISIGNSSQWTMVLVPTLNHASFGSSYQILILVGGLTMLVTSVCLGYCVRANSIRMERINQVQHAADEEKALLQIQSAKQAAANERELNEFIAHEVRNPLSAAISACSFVSSAVVALHHHRDAASVSDRNKRSHSFTAASLSARDMTVNKEAHADNTNDDTQHLEEDISIIDSSLHFINDLLRTMLDMHRASSEQIPIHMSPTEVLSDILEPTSSMLYIRNQHHQRSISVNKTSDCVQVLVECDPPSLMVRTDALRLKQVMLNLARNSTKFVERGYIRLSARIVQDNNMDTEEKTEEDSGDEDGGHVVDGCHVQLSVEDSGPGIPVENRARLFAKFQESLDSLAQGTGMGLCLCMKLSKLLHINLWLDEHFDSGVPGCPGTRFVLDLKEGPFVLNDDQLDKESLSVMDHCVITNSTSERLRASFSESSESAIKTAGDEEDATNNNKHNLVDERDIEQGRSGRLPEPSPPTQCLPDKLSVLFVDDDMILRKLFARAIRTVAPNWTVKEAANGETALRLAEESEFDLIFMDQYMASVEKQLLGTEATRALRAMGVTSRICGLSANDVELSFYEAGADAFLFKPFPSNKEALTRTLLDIIYD